MKKLGEILKETCNLTDKAIDEAIDGRTGNEKIGELLIRNKEVDELDVLKALGDQLQIEVKLALPPEIQTEFTEKIGISFLKKYKIVPIVVADDTFIAINDPTNFQPVDDLRRVLGLGNARTVICPYQAIVSAINYAYDMTQDTAEEVMQDMDEEDPEQLFSEIEEVGDLLDDTSDSPVIRLVNFMFAQAVRDGASDIHIEPYQNSLKIRQRLDGILYDMFSPPKHVQSTLVSRVKIMAKLDIAEKRLPQDGRIELKVGNKEIDVRVSTLPTAFGERVVLRLLDKSSVLISMSDLGMPQDRLKSFLEQIKAANGIVLVTGPTGSGKTTTLYAALTSINNTDINIITVEDPIEYRISGIGQVQVNPKINLTFASGLRSIVRQDPDVILVGEIRDTETAEIAIQSALTGHLVFSTLHTNDAPSAVTRLRDMGIEPFLIASSINAILAQRLVRVLCQNCKEPYTPDQEELMKIGLDIDKYRDTKIFRSKGCGKCHHTGYKGRQGIFELLLMNKDMKSCVLTTSDANEIRRRAIEENGLVTLRHDGARKVLEGTTTIEEVYRVCQE
ncbi:MULTISPECIES: type II secretion system ATPase GspE [Desulfosediminicola]|uniref:type II secretion system ATPase GspE n=1 Tax=Desulfosediminicola TaxID=2886823 RepID=UPI0010ACA718|nr:type II secretion system ATPase GspE [Desulfosediminicola ganghwensis]